MLPLLRESTEIVVFKLLVLGGFVSHEGSSGEHQVGTGRVQRLVDKKVFLFPAEERFYMFYLRVKIICHCCCRAVNTVEGAQQGGLVVKRLAGV